MVHRVEEGDRDTSSKHHDAIPIPPEALIVLVSSSLEEFSVKASTLFQSDLFRGLLDHELGFKEYWERRVYLEGVESKWVKRVIEYLEFKEQYTLINCTTNSNDMEDMPVEGKLIPHFEVKESEAVELAKIADYLQL